MSPKAQHTPGPWVAEVIDSEMRIASAERKFAGSCIATVGNARWAGGDEMRLTPKQHVALADVAWGTKHFGGLISGGDRLPRIRALEKKGLIKSNGMVVVCDADGWQLEPERYREGWSTTVAGEQLLSALEEK